MNNTFYANDEELLHYGVLGMKWGVRRSLGKSSANERLRKKALNYDKKAAISRKKSEKAHAEYDLERSNKAATKAAKYSKKAAVVKKKALKETDAMSKMKLERKAAKLEYKSAKKNMDAERVSMTTGYGIKAAKYAVKSDKLAKKAAKTRLKIATNEVYIAATKQKVKSIPESDLKVGQDYVKRLFE